MTYKKILAASILAVAPALAACGGGKEAKDNGPSAEEFAAACNAQLEMPESVCECIGEKAESDLTQEERNFAYASITGDLEATEKLRAELGVDGAMKAGMFFVNAPADCAREEAGE